MAVTQHDKDNANALIERISDMLECSRRHALAILAGAGVVAHGEAYGATATQSLGAIAAKNGLMFGAAAGPVIDKDLAYRELYTSQTKIVTTDIAMKMGTIAPQPGAKRFESADRLLQFCTEYRIPMRGHCLIWNEWVPQWVKSMSVHERKVFFDRYIEEVVGRYAGKLQSWDIVNEPFWPGHKAPGGYRLGPWYDAFGTNYVRRAFERAAIVDKETNFVLNEAHAERDDDVGRAVRTGLLRLVDELQHAGVRLQCGRPAGPSATALSARSGALCRVRTCARRAQSRYLHHRVRRARRHVSG